MPRVVCVVILTLAALGVVFIVVLVVCAFDGFATWKRWRKLSSAFKELDAVVLSAREQAKQREQAMRNNVADLSQIPRTPCNHHECPHKARG